MLLIPLPALASDTVQGTLKQMHEVNERGLLRGQREGLKVEERTLETRESLDQSFYDQQARDAHLPQVESKRSVIQSRQRALDAQQKQLDVTIPPPPPPAR